jgi:uncharacterized membrane protein YkvA (DUF1232 family)
MKKLFGTYAAVKGISGAKKGFSPNSTWAEDFSDFIQMVKAAIKGTYRIRKRTLVFVLTGLVYIISPIDFLPALILGPIGLVDDAAILLFVYKRITSELDRYRKEAKYEEAEILS